MHDVMTMHDILAEKIVPAHEHLDFIVGKESRYVATLSTHENLDRNVGGFIFVMAAAFGRLNCFRCDHSAINFMQQEFGEVRVDRMRPILAVVSQDPNLAGSLFNFGIDSRAVAERLPIDRPKAAEIVKGPDPVFELAQIFRHRRQWPEMIRYLTVIRAGRWNYVEPHNAVTRIEHPAGRTAAVCLLEPILKNDLITGLIFRKVQNHVGALG